MYEFRLLLWGTDLNPNKSLHHLTDDIPFPSPPLNIVTPTPFSSIYLAPAPPLPPKPCIVSVWAQGAPFKHSRSVLKVSLVSKQIWLNKKNSAISRLAATSTDSLVLPLGPSLRVIVTVLSSHISTNLMEPSLLLLYLDVWINPTLVVAPTLSAPTPAVLPSHSICIAPQ